MQSDPVRAIRVLLISAKVIAIGFVGLIVFGVTTVFFIGDSCKNTPQATILSPGGLSAAVVFERNCGATTGFSSQVSIVPKESIPITGGGNTLVADTDHGAAPSAQHGGPEIRLKWLSENRLSIAHHSKARIFKNESRVGNIEIIYSQFAQ